MQIRFSFKHMETSQALITYTEKKIGERITKLSTKPITAHVTFVVDHHEHIAHCSVTGGDGLNIEVQQASDDMYASVDLLSDKLTAQLKKAKDKLKDHKGKPSKGELATAAQTGGGRKKDKGGIDIANAEIDADDILKFESQRKRAGRK